MISFVVPAFDEERFVAATVRSIHAAARACGEPYEVIVVDDASSDGTAEIARAEGARVVAVAHRQIAATRNSGARSARGEILIFVDADTRVDEIVVRAALRELASGAVGGGAGVRFDGQLPLYARILTPILRVVFRSLGLACGCFVYCTRRVFHDVGGFDEALFGAEEIAFSGALKRQGRFVVLREAVTSSGRKMRAYTGWEILSIFGGLALRGPASVKRRRGMDIWYGKRRDDPGLAG